MCEKWNSGLGGYICDTCRVLLWAGHKGSERPENRHFIYSTNEEDVVQDGDKFFCSTECKDNYTEDSID